MIMRNSYLKCVVIVGMALFVSSCSYFTSMGRLEKAIRINDIEAIKSNLPSSDESLSTYSAEDLIVVACAYARLYDASGNEDYGDKAIEALHMAREKNVVKAMEKIEEFDGPQRIDEPRTLYNQIRHS